MQRLIQEGRCPPGRALLVPLLFFLIFATLNHVSAQDPAKPNIVKKSSNVQSVKPLDNDGDKMFKSTEKPTIDIKSNDASESKSSKKSTIKSKLELKKSVTKDIEITTVPSDITTTMTATTTWRSTEETSVGKKTMIELPLLLRGEPVIPTTAIKSESTEAVSSGIPSKARALNVSASEPGNTLHPNVTDLSNVSMDEDYKELKGGEYSATNKPVAISIPTILSTCFDGNKTYVIGEKIKRGCNEQCKCSEGGKITSCEPITCDYPYVKANGRKDDNNCQMRNLTENPCCAEVVCIDSVPEPEEICVFGNTTVRRGQKVEDGCTKICLCEAGGYLKCQPRCDTNNNANQSDHCVSIQDPKDSCCIITLCDVTLGDHEIKSDGPSDLSINLTDVKVLNSTAIKLKLSSKLTDEVIIEISENNHVWRQVKPTKDGILGNLLPAHSYYVRVAEGSRTGPAIHITLLAEVTKTNVSDKSEKGTCTHLGETYKIGAEWYDECIAVCYCNETAQTECVTIQCPTDFGLDVLDPHCLDWETVPPNHIPKAPNCCPQEVRCRNNGSCVYEGKTYDNWSRLPTNVTGCEKECFCQFGNVTCNPACPPVSQLPPMTLSCKAHEAILTHLPDDECCLHWACPKHSLELPGKNSSYKFSGPIAIISNEKQTKDKSEISQQTLDTTRSKPFSWPITPSPTYPSKSAVLSNSDILHYPMDPGHPTIPYMGPYNPDFKPTQPSVEEVFHLEGHVEKSPAVKEKNKSKSESKKPVDVIKSHKDGIEQFPGPLAPDRFPEKIHSSEKPLSPTSRPISPNKLPGFNKGGAQSDHVEQPQFIPLNVHDHAPGTSFNFVPNNGENIPPSHFDKLLENPAAGPPYGARPESADPNNVVPTVTKKKVPGLDLYSGEKGKPVPPQKVRPEIPSRNPTPEEELYHLINLQHPGLVGLPSTAGHPGLYDIQQEIANGAKPAPQVPPVPSNYFGSGGLPPKKGAVHGKPQIYTQKDENGQTTYHVHAAEVPSTHQQLEELLAHIAQHDPNNKGSYRQQGGVPQDSEPSSQGPIGISANLGPHGFIAQAPAGQSGFEHNTPIGQYPSILSTGNPNLPGYEAYEISVEDLRAISANSVRLMFTVPSVLVGLHGRVEVRYTSDKSNADPLTWKSQTFAPPGDLIDTEDLEFELSGLKPSTVYRLMIVVKLRDLANTHISKIYQVRTLDKPSANSPPTDLNIDSELRILEINSTYAEFEWKKFTNYELQFIDGVYLMYRAVNEKTYSVTPLLHRTVNHYVLDHLKPSTTYEVHLSTKDIIGQNNVLIDSKTVNFTTTAEVDTYSFDVKVEIKTIKSTEVEVSWSGVPQPQEKYVNIYRAVYQSDNGKEDTSTFKIAKKDAPTKTIISDLKPGTRYRLWLEIYLTNGKIKKSDVKDFVTKPGVLQQGKLASIPLHEGDYYGPLVIVAIVASLAILSTLILLMMLMKRRTSSKADISPRKTTSAYDNPSYKTCEDTVPNSRNNIVEHEMQTMNESNGNAK